MARRVPSNAPLKELDADYNNYRLTTLKYPANVENLSHLMMFNINVNEFSSNFGVDANGIGKRGTSEISSRSRVLRKDSGGIQASDISKGGVAEGIDATDLGAGYLMFASSRKTVRINTAISLYVPDTLVFDDTQNYENLSLTKELGPGVSLGAQVGYNIAGKTGAFAGAGLAALSGIALSAVGGVIKSRASMVGLESTVGAITKGIGKAAALAPALLGFSLNPLIEVIYRQPNLREFQFDFNFAPTSQIEADTVGDIIWQFRRHQAPELNQSSGIAGAAFLPPSEFDISFHRATGSGFAENLSMPRISTCILKAVNTNYAPQMFATFKDGSSINITLRLAFMELDLMTRERIDQGF